MLQELVLRICLLGAEYVKNLMTYYGQIRGAQKVDMPTPIVKRLMKERLSQGEPTTTYEARQRLVSDVFHAVKINQLPRWLRDAEGEQEALIGSMNVRGTYEESVHPSALRYFTKKRTLEESGLKNKQLTSAMSAVQRRLTEWGFPIYRTTLPIAEAVIGAEKNGLGSPFWNRRDECRDEAQEISTLLRRALEIDSPQGRYWYTSHHAMFSWSGLLSSLGRFEGLTQALPSTVGMRGQAKGNYRQASFRAIHQYSTIVVNLEKSWLNAMMPNLKKAKVLAAYGGPSRVNQVITEMLTDPQGYIWSIDYSGFDASIPGWLINAAFDVLWNVGIPEDALRNEWTFLKSHFITADLLTPCGRLSGRCGGLPSGSGFTNLIGCVVNLIVMELACARFGLRLHRIMVCGDDAVCQIIPHGSHPFCLENVTSWIYETCGMTLHPEKQQLDYNSAHFLQNVHRAGYLVRGECVGVRPVMRVLNGMLSYERFKPGWSGAMDTLRWIQQIEAARNHPCFPAFVRWFSEHDRTATESVPKLIQDAGGLEAVQKALSTGFNLGKTPIELLDSTLTARMLTSISKGGDPWDLRWDI